MAQPDLSFFEGTEKLLEMWFSSTMEENANADLRKISRVQWEDLLQHVNCEIISQKEDGDMTAYLLSESSMFVSKDRFILKTCGKTTLFHAMKPLLELVKKTCGMDKVDDVFYSRRKFMKPELQLKPHTSFEDEVEFMDELFEDGAAYCLGRMNKDCWYLYTIDQIGVEQPDQTLEVAYLLHFNYLDKYQMLMTDLDPSVMALFTKETSSNGKEATKLSGIDTLIPGTIIDDYLFDPCGYSMNGILPGGKYFTIHITPEPHCSYVSFESNVPQQSYHDLVTRLLSLFKPGKFLMTIFANKASAAVKAHKPLRQYDCFKNYTRVDSQLCQFKNYNLSYANFKKAPTEKPPVI